MAEQTKSLSKEEQLKLNLDKCYRLIERTYSVIDKVEEIALQANLEYLFADDTYDMVCQIKRELEEFEMLNGHEIEELLK